MIFLFADQTLIHILHYLYRYLWVGLKIEVVENLQVKFMQ